MQYDKSMKEEILKYIEDNPDKKLGEVSKKFGIPYSTLYGWCTRACISITPHPSYDKEYCIKYCQLEENKNKTLSLLSHELCIPPTTLGGWLSNAGISRDIRCYGNSKVPKKDWIKYVNDHPCKPLLKCAEELGISRTALVVHLQRNNMEFARLRSNIEVNIPKNEWIDYVRSHPEKSKSQCAADIGITYTGLYEHLKKYASDLITPRNKNVKSV